jgi:hypothetical protein
MTPQEIFTIDAQRNKKRPGALIHGVAQAVDLRGAKLFHDNKIVLILEPIDERVGDWFVHMFSGEPPLNLKYSAPVLLRQVRGIPGIRRVYGSPTDLQILDVLRSVGFPVKKSDKKKFNWMVEV